MTLKDRISEDLKGAIKSGDKPRLSVVRLLKSEIINKEIQKGGELEEDEIFGLLSSMIRKRKEAIEQFKSADRQDLVDRETKELEILRGYQPAQLSETELQQFIDETIKEIGADDISVLGEVMKTVMPKLRGRAEGALIRDMVAKCLKSA
ncbi:MAG: GatB/YqeY domain-containing protein [Candidatus Zixiibacteriota bacterium]|nr:MAG: GatB/YqeY domain-containing protein [candidate division Zixibacteria bacterium]